MNALGELDAFLLPKDIMVVEFQFNSNLTFKQANPFEVEP